MSKFTPASQSAGTGNSQNQTLSFLLKRFREVGISPVHQLGQNFLIDLNMHRLLTNRAEIDQNDIVLEVGTGTGSMTCQMAPKAARVITVELDKQLFALSQEDLGAFDNIVQINEDILRNKNNLNPNVLAEIEKARKDFPNARLKLAANLPYSVATPIISNLLRPGALAGGPPYSMTVTIQKEMGDRITAAPGSKDFCALSIWIQGQCDVEVVRVLPPTVFWPKPKVYSAIVHIQLNPEKRNAIPDLAFFHEYTRLMFLHRRKFLRSELITAYKEYADKSQIDEIMARMNLDGTARSETLSVETHLKLCETMRQLVLVNKAANGQ